MGVECGLTLGREIVCNHRRAVGQIEINDAVAKIHVVTVRNRGGIISVSSGDEHSSIRMIYGIWLVRRQARTRHP